MMSRTKVWRSSNGRLHSILPRGRLSEPCVAEWFATLERIPDLANQGLVVHAEMLASLDWEAAALLAAGPRCGVRAVAFVTGSASRADDALRLFAYFHKPSFEMRVFASRALAAKWLASRELSAVAPGTPEFVPAPQPMHVI